MSNVVNNQVGCGVLTGGGCTTITRLLLAYLPNFLEVGEFTWASHVLIDFMR